MTKCILDVILESEAKRLPSEALEELTTKFSVLSESSDNKSGNSDQNSKFRIIQTEQNLEDMMDDLGQHTVLTIDLETTGVDVFKDNIVGVGICCCPDYGYYIPVGHDWIPGQLEITGVMLKLRSLFAEKKVVAHNAKFEYQFFRRHGITLDIGFDPMIAYQLTDEVGKSGLKVIAPKILDVADWSLNLEKRPANARAIREVGLYCIRDCLYTHQLYEKLEAIMRGQYSFIFFDVELPIIKVVAEMELTGVPVDDSYISQLKSIVPARLTELTTEIYGLAGKEFNINSAQQLGVILFEDLGLPILEQTDTGQPKTDKFTLSKLKDKHVIIKKLLEHRTYEKLRSSYLEPAINTDTGRIHRPYRQIGAQTGRMTGSGAFHPMTMPKDEAMPTSVREAVGGLLGHSIVCADYAGQEVSVLLSYCADETMTSIVRKGLSVHSYVAQKLFNLGCPTKDVKKLHPGFYNAGKALNFGIIYGKTAYGLSEDLTALLGKPVSKKEAQKIIDNYFEQFPKVKTWLDEVVKNARKRGYAEDIAGRRRRFPILQQKLQREERELWKRQKKAEREAKNFMVQGLAATQTKRAMVRCHEQLSKHHPQAKIIAARHDEIVFLVPDDELNAVCALIKDAMEKDPELAAKGLDVPAEVEITYGPNWCDKSQQTWTPKDGNSDV